MNPSSFSLSQIYTSALILASVALSGCTATGTIRVEDPVKPVAAPVAQAPTGVIATNSGAEASSVGGVVSTVGSSIANTEMAGIDNGVMTALGGAVQKTGTAVDVLGTGTGDNFGQTGNQEANMLAIQMESAPLIVEQLGGAVSSVGDAVAAIDNGQLSVLSPVTDPAGALLNDTGAGIASLSGNITTATDNAVVQQVTRSGSTLIQLVAIEVTAATQNLGASTGLGAPANNLLVDTGSAVNHLGGDISTAFADSPALSSTGGVVSATGTLVSSVGGLLTPPTTGTPTMSTGSTLTTLSTPSDLSNLVGSLSSVSSPAGPTPLASIGGVLGRLPQ